MSADNWAICPCCKVKEDEEKRARAQAAEDAYGKVSAGQYLNLVNAAKVSVKHEESLREDYEIGVFDGATFVVTYISRCQKCGWSHKFRHEEQI